jgi:Ni/Co efflux regulator RcnB
MKRFLTVAMALALTAGFAQSAMAQPHHDWKKGGRIEKGDWNRGQHVDYKSHHLRRPGRGQEWRQVDGNYVLAAAATGLIVGLAAAH